MSWDAKAWPSAGRSPAVAAVLDFLHAMERRDLEAAGRFLAADFSMCFPGDVVLHSLGELVERSGRRYRSIGKTFDHVDRCEARSGEVVYCCGRLHGVWPDGRRFSDIRFIDRFELAGGLIRRQDVWNDLAECLATADRTPGLKATVSP